MVYDRMIGCRGLLEFWPHQGRLPGSCELSEILIRSWSLGVTGTTSSDCQGQVEELLRTADVATEDTASHGRGGSAQWKESQNWWEKS